jgi:hypothetical protein
MASAVDFISSSDNFQANGTVQWVWSVGDASTFQSFSVKPGQFNCAHCGITDLFYVRGNGPGDGMDVFITVNFQDALGEGGLLTFYAIGAPNK